jgi:hypothetical protein
MLVTFCATAALVTSLGLAILFATAAVALGAAQSAGPSGADNGAQTRTFAGVITDTKCGARHAKNSGKNPAECVQACVRKGSSYTLVDGDKAYTLVGNEGDLDKLAGQRVNVQGILDGYTIRVSAVSPPQ